MYYEDYAIDFDNTTTIVADIKLTKDSFSHEFGNTGLLGFETSNFRVYADVGGNIVDVTNSLSSIELASLKKAYNDEVDVMLCTGELSDDEEECA